MTPTQLPLQGVAASPGYSQGKIYFLNPKAGTAKGSAVSGTPLEQWQKAQASARVELQELIERARKAVGANEAQIFETHLMFLDDPEFCDSVVAKIKMGTSALKSLKETADDFIELFSSLQDPYLRERALDIKDVSRRLQNHLEGRVAANYQWDEPVVVVAEELTPSETLLMDPSKVLAFVTEKGGATSHTVILARNLGIPAIVGVKNLLSTIQNLHADAKVLVDAYAGEFWMNPPTEVEEEFFARQRKETLQKEIIKTYKTKTVETKSGEKMHLKANIGSTSDLHLVHEFGAEGIGLFRTEFLFMGKTAAPTEEEQFAAYKQTAEAVKPYRAVIRTLDIGGDKELPYMQLPKEENPFLGIRGQIGRAHV